MADTNTTLGAAGAGETIDALGKRWSLTPTTQRSKAAFEAWVEHGLRTKLLARRDLMTEAEFADEALRIDANSAAGLYAYGGPVWRQVIGTADGSLYLFYLLLRQKHKGMTEALAKEVLEDGGELARWAFRAALHKADPNLFASPGECPAREATPNASESSEGGVSATPAP